MHANCVINQNYFSRAIQLILHIIILLCLIQVLIFIVAIRKCTVTPSVPMKPLYWTRILVPNTQQHQETDNETDYTPLWADLNEIDLDNMTEFTDLFSRQVIKKKPTKKKIEIKSKTTPKKLLDSKRSQNVGILAQSLHVEFQEIEAAIYGLDTSVVSLEALQQIYEAVSLISR